MNRRPLLRWIVPAALAVTGCIVGIVLAQNADDVRSGHTYHVKELETACADCHQSITESADADERNVPGHEVCFECHDGSSAPDACETCHTNSDEAAVGMPIDRTIRFSHKAHLPRKDDCRFCHTEAGADSLGQTIYALPDMARCTESCHNGRKASVSCEMCHTNVSSLLPKDHLPGWTQRHDEVARTELETCGQCHVQEQDCDICHRGDNLRGIPHREGFMSTHAFDFHAKTKDCGSCHDIMNTCVPCHTGRGIVPANHFAIGDWANREEGGRHTDFAEGDLESCAICHDREQPVCMGCHGPGGVAD